MVAPVLSQTKRDYLHSLYYNVDKVGSLRGPKDLYNAVKRENLHQISLRQIEDWLRGQAAYTKWKEPRVKYERNAINAVYPGHLFQFDLMDQHLDKEFSEETGEYMQYALIGVDSFRYTPLHSSSFTEIHS